MKIKFLLLLIFVIPIGGILVPKLLIQDAKSLLQEEVDCAKRETHLLLDNPFERVLEVI